MQTVIGLFDRYEDADRAVQALKEAGFVNQRISVAAREGIIQEVAPGEVQTGEEADEILEKAGSGAAGASVVGGFAGLLVGLGMLTIPGLGPVIAAGTLATTLATTVAGAGIGAAAGGVVGALQGMGIERDRAETYAEGVKRGGILVMVESDDDSAGRAETILNQAGGVDVDARRSEWIADGWTHFDENVIPPSHFPGGISTL